MVNQQMARKVIPDNKLCNGDDLDRFGGVAIGAAGEALVVIDNDGRDEGSGETLCSSLGTM